MLLSVTRFYDSYVIRTHYTGAVGKLLYAKVIRRGVAVGNIRLSEAIIDWRPPPTEYRDLIVKRAPYPIAHVRFR